MSKVEFLETTELDQRGIRRLAQSRGASVTRNGDTYSYNGVVLSDDEVWGVLASLPQVQTLGGKGRSVSQ